MMMVLGRFPASLLEIVVGSVAGFENLESTNDVSYLLQAGERKKIGRELKEIGEELKFAGKGLVMVHMVS